MKLWLFFLAVSGLALAGCARVSTETTLNSDGSYSRKIDFKMSKTAAMSGLSGGGDAESTNEKKVEDYFKIPSGAGLKVTRKDTDSDSVVTVVRTGAAGADPVQDIALWADKGKILATSTVVVNKLPDGRLEYVEVLHSTQLAKDLPLIKELRPQVKKAIPASHQTTEVIDKVTREVAMNLTRALFGPPEPTLFSIFSNPELALRRINIIAYNANVRTLQDAGLTEAEAKDAAKTLAQSLTDEVMNQSRKMEPQQQSAPEQKSSDNEMTPMTFSLKFPGQIVESNGLFDPLTGEVYWSLMPAGLEAGDVKLRVVVDPGGQAPLLRRP
jgi:hypothetical protein